MKKVTISLLMAAVTILSACSKDAEVNAFVQELDAATHEIVTTIDAEPTAAGVEKAQSAFDNRKAQLSDSWIAIKDAVGAQVSADTKKKLEESVASNMQALTAASIRNMMKMAADKEASAKFQRLMEDYSKTFRQ